MKFLQKIVVCTLAMTALTACQSLKTKTPIATNTENLQNPISHQDSKNLSKNFNINGKIGLTTPQQAGSAFYVWTQQENRFAIELAGALNVGQTNINYNGTTATLTTNQGEMTAEDPEELLFKATGWQAPISQLPYWIMGQLAPSDEQSNFDEQQRVSIAKNADWTATFSYKNQEKLPQKLNITHPTGYKVVLTINHLSEPQ